MLSRLRLLFHINSKISSQSRPWDHKLFLKKLQQYARDHALEMQNKTNIFQLAQIQKFNDNKTESIEPEVASEAAPEVAEPTENSEPESPVNEPESEPSNQNEEP